MDFNLGSTWGKWDLHVHSPCSLHQNYGGDNEEAWEKFITDLEMLPREFKVIGINDYFFVEGYKKILKKKKEGRLSNILLFLPVIELRLKIFGGSESKLSKANFHVIFSNELDPKTIEEQFISALSSSYMLSSETEGMWKGSLTKNSIEDFGKKIIESSPPEKQKEMRSPLKEGFANLTFSKDMVFESLDKHFFKGKYLTAIGNTEWADIKWKEGSIGDKKDLINKANLVFVSSETVQHYKKNKESLENGNVNSKLLDCSDAHEFSNSKEKDRIGNCFTWIKAAPTFQGLKRVATNFTHRVFIGEEPELLKRKRQYPSRFLEEIEIRKKENSSLNEEWFDSRLKFNPGMIAIIGNKGSGKSALAEIIGLLGNAFLENKFSFLNESKFKDPKNNIAKNFQAKMIWGDGNEIKKGLEEAISKEKNEKVKLLPQKYLEELCTEEPKGEKTEFDKQLENIIFSHIPEKKRLGEENFEKLIETSSKSINFKLNKKRDELFELNEEIEGFEEKCSEEYKNRLREKYIQERKEWVELKKAKPTAVQKPSEKDPLRIKNYLEISQKRKIIEHLSSAKKRIESEETNERTKLNKLENFFSELENLFEEHNSIMEKSQELFQDLKANQIVSKMEVNWELLRELIQNSHNKVSILSDYLDEDKDRNIPQTIRELREEIEELNKSLNAEEQKYQDYLQKKEEWEKEVERKLGNPNKIDSLLWLRKQYYGLKKFPKILAEKKGKREDIVREIHGFLYDQTTIQKDFYSPLKDHIEKQNIPSDFLMDVTTTLVDTGFERKFLEEFIDRNIRGSFCGIEKSREQMKNLLAEVEFNNVDKVISCVNTINDMLHHNYQTEGKPKVNISNQLKKGKTTNDVYNYVFSLEWLSSRFSLEFGKKPVHKLSPGEKGVLLLIFFLIADIDTKPLIIDQPEDNLDNQTVFNVLVNCFKYSKERRQVFIVTHNPNLAVVCDSDQVIVAEMEKEPANKISYRSGPIEDPEITINILDILEGTKPAFGFRGSTYDIFD